MEIITRLFDSSGFPARWQCGTGWTDSPWLGWLHVLSDLGVWSAYVAIPCVLAYFVVRRQDIPFRMIFLLFGAFILACGTTHLMEAIIFWWPAYRLAGVIKLFTAVVSWATVIALVPIVPKALAMRGPEELEREIVARKEAEKSLYLANLELERQIEELRNARLIQEHRERLQVTLRSIGDAVISTDAAGRITFLNPVAEQLTGWKQDDATGRSVLDVFQILNEQTRQPVANPVLRALQEGAIAGLPNQTILVTRDGKERPIDDSAAPIRAESGAILGAVLVFRDVTERRQAEEQLRSSEQRFARFMQNLPGLAWIKDVQGRYVYANTAAEKAFATPQAELYGKTDDDVFPPATAAQFRLNDQQAMASGTGIQVVEELEQPDGELHYSIVSKFPIPGSEDQTTLVGGIAIDITEQRRVEEALRDADRRKDQFLATLAHELRNPLAPIRNSLQILKMPRVDAATLQQTRDMMERQVHHLVRLVDDLLDVSRVMRGKIELRKEPVELATIVARAVETANPLIEAQEHQLEISIPPESLLLDADPIRLVQVVGNLLTNSAKYSESSGHIWLSAGREGNQAVLKIRDAGIGIAPDVLPHVFELFVQADSSSTKSQGGLGIGLTLVKNLVEMHEGIVEAHSAGLNQGCEFVIRLPLMLPQVDQVSVQVSVQESVVEKPATPRSGYRLLVVDDNRDAAITLAVWLRLQGHEVRIAHDGPTALELATSYGPDLIFLDIGMPGMDGYEVARRIRQQPGLEKVVLAALTGWGQQEDRRRTADAGFDHHLVKPAEPKDVDTVLAQLKRDPSSSQG